MKTKIGLVYFKEKLTASRQHHSVHDELIKIWLYFYNKSKTKMLPCLLLDKKTNPPKFWNYEYKIIEDSEPPFRLDVLHKVGWIKSQAYDYLGKCLVMDLDCIIIKSLDELDTIDSLMGMPLDSSGRTYENWPEIGQELNAGLILQNSKLISNYFKIWWHKKKHFMNTTYFDELVFSCICRQLNGLILSEIYNMNWEIGNNSEMIAKASIPNTKILHFHGLRKSQLSNFIRYII